MVERKGSVIASAPAFPALKPSARVIAVAGNPNTGKTTLFNRVTALRAKTANFPGTTIDLRHHATTIEGEPVVWVDLPGLYSLTATAAEERIALHGILGNPDEPDARRPDAIVVVLDATHLVRNLFLASQLLELGTPVIAALNMMDVAERRGIVVDVEGLARHLGCPVVPMSAKNGTGLDALTVACAAILRNPAPPGRPRLLQRIDSVSQKARFDWAETVTESCVTMPDTLLGRKTEAIDRYLTHPVTGVGAFLLVMLGIFYLIFSLATVPMDLIEAFTGTVGGAIEGILPDGLFQSLMVDGIIAGVGGVIVFLPQICILYFCISILEDTGYLARAALVMDRVLRRFGLPGKAFVPLLSTHACTVPAIMSARIIEDRRDRMTTILVLPLMACSARLPVYAMIAALLFHGRPFLGALLFTFAYALGIVASLGMALLFRRTVMRGDAAPLMIELPDYRVPSLRTALFTAYERGKIFTQKAGTIILAISIVLWWLMTFPRLDEDNLPPATEAAIASVASEMPPADAANGDDAAESLEALREHLVAQAALEHSFAGRVGKQLEPVFAPLGFDWRISVGVIVSFAAREVFVAAMGVVYGVGEEPGDALLERLRNAQRADGTRVFTPATSASVLVFFVLAMQCLATLAITRRETNSWGWALFQWAYMFAMAYGGAFVTYQSMSWMGWG